LPGGTEYTLRTALVLRHSTAMAPKNPNRGKLKILPTE